MTTPPFPSDGWRAPEPAPTPPTGPAYPAGGPQWSPSAGGDLSWAQPGYAQPGYPPPSGPWDHLGGPVDPAPVSRRGRLITAVVTAAVLVGGGTATYVALSDKNSTGAGSPQGAVQSIVGDLNNGDLLSALDDLPPGERTALSAPFTADIAQLKRLGVLSSQATASKVTGVTFALTGLTLGRPTAVNDHVQLVPLTGGTLRLSANAAQVPFTSQFAALAFADGKPGASTQTVDIAQAARTSSLPVEVAVQRVGGHWYPSLFYTIAAEATRDSGKTVTAADYIPAAGGSSATDAVTKEVNALLAGDMRTAVALLSPDELGVLHDYGGLFVGSGANPPDLGADVKIGALQFATTSLPGGAVRVTLSSVRLTVDQGDGPQSITVAVNNGCYDVTDNGKAQHLCAGDLINQISQALAGFSDGPAPAITAAQRQALTDLITGLGRVGIDTSQSGGQWYVDPVRSYLDLSTSLLSALKGNDLQVLIGWVQSLGD